MLCIHLGKINRCMFVVNILKFSVLLTLSAANNCQVLDIRWDIKIVEDWHQYFWTEANNRWYFVLFFYDSTISAPENSDKLSIMTIVQCFPHLFQSEKKSNSIYFKQADTRTKNSSSRRFLYRNSGFTGINWQTNMLALYGCDISFWNKTLQVRFRSQAVMLHKNDNTVPLTPNDIHQHQGLWVMREIKPRPRDVMRLMHINRVGYKTW